MKCHRCGGPTIGDNLICDNCREPFNDDDEDFEFIRCAKCDGHDACEDFGCAYELGLGRMVRKNIEPGNDDWN